MTSLPKPAPRIGVGVIVVRDGRILLGKRRGAHGEDAWALPGGHLEHGETIEHCARREVAEETGLIVEHVSLGPYTNDIFTEAGKHYVTLFVIAHDARGEPEVLEPEKCAAWAWFEWAAFPSPLFLPLENLRRSGFVPNGPGSSSSSSSSS